jgi:hypothetical protein
MPLPFHAPGAAAGPEERLAVYEAFRAGVSDLGVSIGHRHFDEARLARYFDESGLDILAERARRARWADMARVKERGIKPPHFFEFNLSDGLVAGMNSWQSLVALMAVGAVMEIAGYLVQVDWNAKKTIEVKALQYLSKGSVDSMPKVLDDYNRVLAGVLGVREDPRAGVKALPPWPATAKLGPNAQAEDWVQEYRLSLEDKKWYLGYHEIAFEDVSPAYGAWSATPVPRSSKPADIAEFNAAIKTRLFEGTK